MPRYASMDEVLASYPTRFNAEKARSLDDTVHMNLTGEGGRHVVLHVKEGQLTVDDHAEAPPENPSLTLTAKAEDWVAVENGHLNPMTAMMTGKIKMKGNPAFAMKFMGLFGYGG